MSGILWFYILFFWYKGMFLGGGLRNIVFQGAVFLQNFQYTDLISLVIAVVYLCCLLN